MSVYVLIGEAWDRYGEWHHRTIYGVFTSLELAEQAGAELGLGKRERTACDVVELTLDEPDPWGN